MPSQGGPPEGGVGTAWLLPRTDPLADLSRAIEEVEALTGLTVDASGAIENLDSATLSQISGLTLEWMEKAKW